MVLKNLFSPFTLPIHFFGAAIVIGAALLYFGPSVTGEPISVVDAVFTATSATCVTGLVVVDTGTYFTTFGQSVILLLIQLGGLGIMTFTTLVFFLWRRRVSLADRIAVGQSLLHNPSFHLGFFLLRIALWTLVIETAGVVLLHRLSPEGFPLFGAVFHSISAFCNAGFSLYNSSLTGFRDDLGINLVFMALIILGGIGFSVLVEMESWLRDRLTFKPAEDRVPLSWYSRVVLQTSLGLVAFGWLAIYLTEFVGQQEYLPGNSEALSALFQSVTCRTAGFNTLEIASMSNVSLLVMILLMLIGGSPGSTAGGIKTTTFRTLVSLGVSQIKDRRQTIIGRYAVDSVTLNKALTLIIFAGLLVSASTVVLSITEGVDVPHPETRGIFLEILFESVSAFATVGLSMGLTPKLTITGKCVITALMFIGRIGPIVMLSALQSLRQEPYYRWPEQGMLIG